MTGHFALRISIFTLVDICNAQTDMFIALKMSGFVTTKSKRREALHFVFYLKKSVAECRHLVTKAYVDYALLISMCEHWF